jgi:hypothetical protein
MYNFQNKKLIMNLNKILKLKGTDTIFIYKKGGLLFHKFNFGF